MKLILSWILLIISFSAQSMGLIERELFNEINKERERLGLEVFGIEPIHQWDGARWLFKQGNHEDQFPNVLDTTQPYWNGGWHVEKERFLNVNEFCGVFLILPSQPTYGDSICQAMAFENDAPNDSQVAEWAKFHVDWLKGFPCFRARLFDASCTKPGGHVIDGRQFKRIAIWVYEHPDRENHITVHIRLFSEKIPEPLYQL